MTCHSDLTGPDAREKISTLNVCTRRSDFSKRILNTKCASSGFGFRRPPTMRGAYYEQAEHYLRSIPLDPAVK
jgi:hypothetical protein